MRNPTTILAAEGVNLSGVEGGMAAFILIERLSLRIRLARNHIYKTFSTTLDWTWKSERSYYIIIDTLDILQTF